MRKIDWDRVDRRFERWYKTNQERFQRCMFTDDEVARSAFYAGVESAIRKTVTVEGPNGSNQD